MKVNFQVPKKQAAKFPSLKLQLSPTNVLALDFCCMGKISANFVTSMWNFVIYWFLPNLLAHESMP